MISTRHLSRLPDVSALRRLMRSIAILDAILCPDWQYRYFSFNSDWAPGEAMGSMRNGQGDHFFALFNASGCWLKGFDHNAALSPFKSDPPILAAGMFEGVPAEFTRCLTEPAFIATETTFCIWRRFIDSSWNHRLVAIPSNIDADGSAKLLQYLDGIPATYHQWAEGYYERTISIAAVKAIYAHHTVDADIVHELNPELSLTSLNADMAEIGYPER